MSPAGPTRISEVTREGVTELSVSPEQFALPRVSLAQIRGGDAGENAAVLERVLAGEDHPSAPAFVLNAAAALVVAEGLAPRDAAERIQAVLRSGAALGVLERWRAVAQAEKARAATAG